MKSQLETGNIYEISLAKDFGYGYCRYINVADLIGRFFDSHMIEAFDFISDEPIKNIDVLLNKGILFGPVFLNGTPRVKGDKKWRLIGVMPPETIQIPEFKGTQKFPFIFEDESLVSPWFAVDQIKLTKIEKSYDKLKHLEQANMLSDLQIRSRIVMEFLRKQGKNVLDYFDIEKEGDAVRFAYYLMKNMPIYSEIPKEIRGKSLP